LQTWSLIAHGTTSNPNDLVDGSGSGLNGGNKNDIATGTSSGAGSGIINAPRPSVVEFDGSVNSLAPENEHDHQTSNSQSPHLFAAANSDIAAADSSVSILSTSVASSPSSSAHCAKVSNNGQCLGWCLLILLAFSFFSLNPAEDRTQETSSPSQHHHHHHQPTARRRSGPQLSPISTATISVNYHVSPAKYDLSNNTSFNSRSAKISNPSQSHIQMHQHFLCSFD